MRILIVQSFLAQSNHRPCNGLEHPTGFLENALPENCDASADAGLRH